ncbi:hypothetical protein [Dactylosporangium sp. CA-139066]|uniref:hypothetical protein n=1 Tax=Dactylosporangium sp. CA-139066 TaxID=3239930 RepID=UPI003D8ABA7F
MATTVAQKAGVRRSVSSGRRDLVVALATVWLAGGLFMDGWAHTHVPSLETFFTPWHGVLYSGYAALAVSLVPGRLWRGRPAGPMRDWVPAGYGLGLLGAILFAAGGAFDMTWHIVFGIEVDLEALLSPPHLILLTAGALMIATPIRAAAAKRPLRAGRGTSPTPASDRTSPASTTDRTSPALTSDRTSPTPASDRTSPALTSDRTSPAPTSSRMNPMPASGGTSPTPASGGARLTLADDATDLAPTGNEMSVASTGDATSVAPTGDAMSAARAGVGGSWTPAADVPVLISAATATAVAAFFLDYLSPFTDAPAAMDGYGNGPAFGAAQYLTYSVLILGAVFFVWSRLGRVPVGLITVVVAAASVPNGVFDDFENLASQLWPLAGAVIADLAVRAVAVRRPDLVPLGAGVLIPLLIWPTHLIGVETSVGVAWSLELWSGVVVLTMLAGAVLGGLFLPRTRATADY